MVNPTYEKLGSAPSMIRELFAYGLRRSAEVGPENVFDYSLGNPSIPAPQPVQQALLDVLHDTDPIQVHGYSMAGGFDGTRRAVAEDLTHRFGMTIRPEELFFTCGAAAALISVIRALTVSPDSEFVAIAPYFPEYLPFVESNGGKLVSVPADLDTFQISLDILEAHLTSHTQAVLVNSPNNPTGCIYSRETIQAIHEVVREHPLFLLCDEVYRDLADTEDYESLSACSDLRPRLIVAQSFSKPYAMTGWRLGYALGPVPVIAQMTKLHQYGIMSAPTTAQYAAIEALRNGDRDVEMMRGEYDMRRRLVVDSFNAMGLTCFEPLGAFYVFPCIKSTGLTSEEFCTRLIVDKHVAVVPGTAFGESGEGFVRVSYSYSIKHLKIALERIKEFLDELKKG